MKCRLCGTAALEMLLADAKVENGTVFCLLKCRACSFVSTAPVLDPTQLQPYYGAAYWHQAGSLTGMMRWLFSIRMSEVVSQIKKHVAPGGRVLDWGAGDGHFMELLEKHGYRCWGVDKYSTATGANKIFHSGIEDADLPAGEYDAVTCLQVLEHIEKPVEAVQCALQLLRKGGLLLVEVPNIDSVGFKMFRNRWQPLELPVHLNHFSKKSIEALVRLAGSSQLVEMQFFSGRISTSAIVLSFFPALAPPIVRRRYGKYPSVKLLVYLLLQIAALPLAIMESALNGGAVIRASIIKT